MSISQDAANLRRKLEDEEKIKVSVALFGQPGSGKSSLINKIIGEKLAEVGVETDKTVEEARYEHNGLVFVDLPGYGTSQFPRETYFEKFDIPSFDLFLCVTSGKLHQADTEFFKELSRRGKICIFVVNKHDELWEEGISTPELEQRKEDDIKKHVEQSVRVIFTSCRNGAGLDQLITEIQSNLDGAKRERWTRSAKAYSEAFLAEKKQVCEKYVAIAAGAAAANGINPIPGADISVDLGILFGLFKQIRECYGLSDEGMASLKKSTIPVVAQLANNTVKFATKEGLFLLLKRYLGKQALKSFSKYIPLVGQAIAVTAGYLITSHAGKSYLDDCHQLAEEALRNHLST